MAIDHNYPHALIYGCEDLKEQLEAVAGVRWQHWRKRYIVPHHAVEQVGQLLGERDYECSGASPCLLRKNGHTIRRNWLRLNCYLGSWMGSSQNSKWMLWRKQDI